MKNITEILETKSKRTFPKSKWRLLVGALTAVLLFAVYSPADDAIDLSNMRVAQVIRGDMQVQIYGYGRLQSKHQRLLTSEARGVVEQVLLKPGAVVEPDSIILTLSAPDLLERLADAELEFARVKAEYDNVQLQQKDNLLAQDAVITQLQSDLALAQLRVKAESELVREGVVSDLDYQQSQLNVNQLQSRTDIALKRRATLQAIAGQQTQIQLELLTRYESRLSSLRQRIARLNVRAGIHGVVQALAVEIGQSVPQGSELATVGSTSQLIVELRVAQAQADRIAPGHSAQIITQGSEIKALVTRLDPVVTDGRVIVELDVVGELPANARPDLTVEGRINVAFLEDILMVEAPLDAAEFSQKRLFKVPQDQNFAELTELQFGHLSGGQIEVRGGASNGENLIVSDTSQWLDLHRIPLKI